MKYRKLGRTDLDVSVICLGTMTWGRQNTEIQGHEQMDYAFAQGVNFFDTAEMYPVPPNAQTYGRTEEIIGSWFASRKNRDKVVLATKVAGEGLNWIRNGAEIDKGNITLALETSLKRLQTDYIDLYQLHWPNRGSYSFRQNWDYNPQFDKIKTEDNFLEVLHTLNNFIQEGKIRHIGLSNETAWGTMRYLQLAKDHGLPRVQSIQNEYSLLCRLYDTDMQELSIAEDCGLLAWSPLATGMISGKYAGGARPQHTRWSIREGMDRDTPRAHEAVAEYIRIAKKHGLDVCQMALAFVHDRPFVTATIIGATTMDQLKSNIASIDLTLTKDVMKDIEAVYRLYPVPY